MVSAEKGLTSVALETGKRILNLSDWIFSSKAQNSSLLISQSVVTLEIVTLTTVVHLSMVSADLISLVIKRVLGRNSELAVQLLAIVATQRITVRDQIATVGHVLQGYDFSIAVKRILAAEVIPSKRHRQQASQQTIAWFYKADSEIMPGIVYKDYSPIAS
jgi:hypothetical protein